MKSSFYVTTSSLDFVTQSVHCAGSRKPSDRQEISFLVVLHDAKYS